MSTLTVRSLSEETHLALRLRAAKNGRSTEAEVRSILEGAVLPPRRLKIGSEMHRIALEVQGMDDLKVSRSRSRIKGARIA